MDPYRTDVMTTEEERDSLRDLLQTRVQETAQLERLLASAEARLATRGSKGIESVSAPEGLNTVLAGWQDFWRKLGLKLYTSSLRIPETQKGFNRLLVMSQGATANFLYDACSKLFSCWKHTYDLDIITSDRDPAKGAYAVWVRDRVEADEELKNQSANMLARAGVKGMTLPERLVFELKSFEETGQHLDVHNITLCSGSRYPGGNVPDVYWRAEDGGMGVDWDYSGRRGGDLRARAAVSL